MCSSFLSIIVLNLTFQVLQFSQQIIRTHERITKQTRKQLPCDRCKLKRSECRCCDLLAAQEEGSIEAKIHTHLQRMQVRPSRAYVCVSERDSFSVLVLALVFLSVCACACASVSVLVLVIVLVS